jgi:hypothetical protein
MLLDSMAVAGTELLCRHVKFDKGHAKHNHLKGYRHIILLSHALN